MAAAEHQHEPLLTPLHTEVPGRARFAVRGLKRAEEKRRRLQSELASHPELKGSASARTGTVLVFFPRERSWRDVAPVIERAWRAARSGKPAARAQGASAGEAWHRLSPEETLRRLRSSSDTGLSRKEARARRAKHGANRLAPAEQESSWRVFLRQLDNLPSYLLLTSAGISLVSGGVIDALLVSGVVLANAGVGFATESAADRILALLAQLGPQWCEVIREGRPCKVRIEALVPGDILVVKSGARLPADARVLDGSGLQTDESALTGESLPVSKSAPALTKGDVPLAERANMLYRGTAVTAGSGRAVVVATGPATEIGHIQNLVADTARSATPLQRQTDELSRRLVAATCVLSGGVLVAGLLRGMGGLAVAELAVSLAIAAVPEGLPAVATTALAQATMRMRRKKMLLRHLGAVETLGAVRVLGFDKTGTLTENQMAVREITVGGRRLQTIRDRFTLDGRPVSFSRLTELESFLKVCALCNESRRQPDGSYRGSPTESALLDLAYRGGAPVDEWRREYHTVGIEYRNHGRNHMTTTHRLPDGRLWCALKGSPAEVLALCTRYQQMGRERPLSAQRRGRIAGENARLADQALRVLGLACRRGEDEGFTWLGLAGMVDPEREGMRELMARFHQAGIRTAMLTGDQEQTARAVSERLGIAGGDSEVFSRVTPADKLRIVRELQARHGTTAMVGDGINDAPALKAADVGIAMGKRGTEIAREVADAVLLEDDLHALLDAIALGRATYADIRKATHYLVSTNLSETLVVFGAVAAGAGAPLTSIQLLWVNLLTDVFPALALALDPPESDVLAHPPRPVDARLIEHADYPRLLRESLTMTAASLAAFAAGHRRDPAVGRTMAFLTLTTAQLWHMLTARSARGALWRAEPLPRNPYVPGSIALGFGLQAVSLGIRPLRNALGLTVPGLAQLALCHALALAQFFVNDTLRRKLS